VRGLRIRAKDLLELLAAGVSEAEILGDFPYLEHGDIMACLKYAAAEVDHPVLIARYTRYAERDLRHLTARAVGELGSKLHSLDQQIFCYNQTRINDQRAHDIVIRALDAGAITTTQVPEVLHEWREPRHPEFLLPRTTWSLFNAVTEVHKGVNLAMDAWAVC
jgi:hypothetical protein